MTDNEKTIAQFLIKEIGNVNGAFGLLGNLKAESNCNPTNVQNSCEKRLGLNDLQYTKAVDNNTYKNFIHDSVGYGIAQWTYWSRKQNLLNYAKSKNKSIGDLTMQLEFLITELKTSYRRVYNALIKAKNIQEASDVVVKNFERPADQSPKALNTRATYGYNLYREYDTENNKLVAGKKIQLKNEPLYGNSGATSPVSYKTGTFYYWDNKVINGKIRITNNLSNVGKPTGVTGWITF